MDKKNLLEGLKRLSAQGHLSKEEILAAFEEGQADKPSLALAQQNRISAILYFIGGTIVFLGISILIAQNWTELNTATKILTTLGLGMACFIVGALLINDDRLSLVGQAFFFISGLVNPLGLGVLLDVAGWDMSSRTTQVILSAPLFLGYLIAYLALRKTVLLIFCLTFGSWVYFSVTNFLIADRPIFDDWRFHAYRFLLLNLSYLLLGYHFSQDEDQKKTLSNWLMGIGIFGFLGSALALGGWEPEQSIFWELAFPGIIFAVLYLSVYIKSKPFLTFGSLYLMGYISKITAEYFTDSLGWAFSLVMIGFLIIAVGYLAVYLNKKYIR